MVDSKLENCINIMRKLPVIKLEKSINAMTNLIYENDDLLNSFLQTIEQPLIINPEDRGFIECEYNRDGDAHRSPLSNKYFPPFAEGRKPSPELRQFEIELNKIFAIYTSMYYSATAKCSVYAFELNNTTEQGFIVAVLIKNSVDVAKKINDGLWESSNVIKVHFSPGKSNTLNVDYLLTTTVQLWMTFNHQTCGMVNLSGSITRQAKTSLTDVIQTQLDRQFHMEQIGSMIEDMEDRMREHLEVIYIQKTTEIIDSLRLNPNLGEEKSAQLREVIIK